MKTVRIHVNNDGEICLIHEDSLAGLYGEGETTIKRASHVEPSTTMTPGEVMWYADMSPSDGPILGGFKTRQEAIDAEVLWLENNRLGVEE